MASSKTKLLWVAGAGLAWLLFDTTREVKNTIASLRFGFSAGGWPRLVNGQIEIPIKVSVANAGFTDLPLEGLNITLMRVTKTSTYAIAATDPAGVQAPALKARGTTDFTVPVRTSVLELGSELFTILQHIGFNTFAVTGTIQAAGLSLPISPVTFTT